MSSRILVLEDDESLRLVITKALSRAGYEVRATASPDTAIDRFLAREADVLVADVLLGQESFLDRLKAVRSARPDGPVILISAQTTAATALAAEQGGAFDYLPKPFDLDDLVSAVGRALGRAERAPRERRSGGDGGTGLGGRSPAMQGVFRDLARLAGVDAPVLIAGPEGSGRASVAQALHRTGARAHGPLVTAGALQVEREAEALFERAQGGAVLVRRAERLSPAAQARLLEAIEAAGEGAPRLLVTANPGVRGTLDPALYEAIAVGFIAIPPLRERAGDVVLLFRQHLAAAGAEGRTLEPEASALLERYPWPGEVRELVRVAGRIAAQGGRRPVSAAMIRDALAAPSEGAEADALQVAAARFAAGRIAAGGNDAAEAAQALLDRGLIEAALAAAGGVRQEAARLLGLNRNTLARRIEALGLDDQG